MGATRRITVLGTFAAVGALVLLGLPATAAVASPQWHNSYTCTGGQITGNDPSTATFVSIPSGTYSNITVKGICNVQAGAVINVLGNINIAPGAWFDAQSEPSTITVGHDVNAAPGAFVGLGCQPDFADRTGHPCAPDNADGSSTITINGNVTAFGAGLFLLNGVTVKGNVTFIGGGNSMIPWVVKNNTIGGSLTVAGLTVEFFGVLFNSVGRNVTLIHITLHDVDPGAPGVYIVRNEIGRNLACAGLTPGVTAGFPGEVNVIGGREFGQCASLPVL
jgi:hypothetical protein